MFRLCGVAGLIGGLALAAVGADGPAKSPEKPSIEKLISELDDRSFRVREAAGRALEARGEEALPLLRKAIAAAEPEARRRVEVLTSRIERTALLSPKRVTLIAEDKPVKDVVAEISKQTGYKLQWQGDNRARMTIDWNNVTYWEAMEKVLLDAGASMNFDESGNVHLYQQEVYSPYYSHSGPFRLQAVNFSFNKYINLMNLPRNGQNNDHQNGGLYFSFQVQAEPKAPLVGIGEARLIKAEDEHGASLVPVHNVNDYGVRYFDGGGFRNYQYQSQVNMAKPAKDATKAQILKGRLPVTLLSSVRPELTITKIAKGQKGQGVTVELELEEVAEQGKSYTLTMTVKRFDRNPEADPNWANYVWQRIELYDAKGKKYQSQGMNNFINGNPSSVQGSFQFAPPQDGRIGEAAKLVYNQWVTISHEVEFEFRDVPLP